MTTILQINSAARSQGANSTLLLNELTEKLQKSHPGAQVVVRNLQADPLPHLDDAILGAFFTPADKRTAEQAAIAARSEALARESYDPRYGARPLKRVMQRRIENPLATELLKGELPAGATVKVDVADGEFLIDCSTDCTTAAEPKTADAAP